MNPHAVQPISPVALIRSLLHNRQLIFQMTQREVVGRYKGSVMGLLWSFLNPIFMLAVYTFFFSVVFKSRWGAPVDGVEESKTQFAVLIFVGMIVHGLFSEVLNRAPSLVTTNINYVKKVIFPLEILPVISLGAALFHSLVSLMVLLIAFIIFNQYLCWTVVFVPLVLLPLVIISLGFAWMLASLGVFLRDIGQTVAIFTMVLMYLSPVFFPISAMPERYRAIMMANPLTFIIEQAREVIIWGNLPDWQGIGLYTLFACVIAWLGFFWFQKPEKVLLTFYNFLVNDFHPQKPQATMTDIAIRVTDISKSYQVYHNPHDRLKQFVVPNLQRMLGLRQAILSGFWALHNVSFEVKKGEAVGIIGRNGSGKSTLLQIICGTLAPTTGNIEINGRIAALLELGSGFNPEFTGRENVYMNARILGLSKEKIDARFDEIIDFADIGEFIEQPVKTYSSGMFVRLAFAVIVHVDADILIIDEALSVGDAFFTQKCMMHIKKLMDLGVTLLFVSHDSNSVKSLCNSAVLLDHGFMTSKGDTNKVVEAYYGNFVQTQQNISVPSVENHVNTVEQTDIAVNVLNNEAFLQRAKFQRLQNGKAEFINVQLLDESGKDIDQVDFDKNVILRMIVRANIALPLLGLAYHIRDRNGFDLVYSDTGVEGSHIKDTQEGNLYVVDWRFKVTLREGEYTISAMLSIPLDLNFGQVEICDFIPIAVQIKVWRGQALPIYGAVYWHNSVICNPIGSELIVVSEGGKK